MIQRLWPSISAALLASFTMMSTPLGAALPSYSDCESEATAIGGFNIISQE